VSGYIRFDKDLLGDPRVLALAEQWLEYLKKSAPTIEFSETLLEALRSVTRHAAAGSLCSLWSYADTYLREGNALAIALHHLSDETHLPVTILRALPSNWFAQAADGNISLPDYADKNAVDSREKRRLQNRKRVRKWRHKHKQTGNALPSVTRNALPSTSNAAGNGVPRGRARARVPVPVPVPEPKPTHTQKRGRVSGKLRPGPQETESLQQWQRAVPTCNPVAYLAWLDWRESEHDPVPAAIRVTEAEFLATKGTAEQQSAFVKEIVRLRFKRMHDPIPTSSSANGSRKTFDDTEREARELLEGAGGDDPGEY
jgi:hypothetical protein